MAGYSHNEDGTNKTASKSREESYAALREAYKNGSITDDDLKELAKEKNVDADSILTYLKMSNLDREKGMYNKEELPFYKSDLSKTPTKGKDYKVKDGESYALCDDVTITNDNGTYHCKSSYLGDFDYDPSEFAVGYKEIKEDNGKTSKLPVLEYIGEPEGWLADAPDWLSGGFKNFSRITVPNGVKRLDYTFTGQDIKLVPDIPESVISMHYAFADCDKMDSVNIWGMMGTSRIFLPKNLVDMSGAFKNCSELQGMFSTQNVDLGVVGDSGVPGLLNTSTKLPEKLMNITEAWYGCDNMDEVEWSGFFGGMTYRMPAYGGDLTPFLSEEFAKDALAHIADENSLRYQETYGQSVKEYADSRKFNIDSKGNSETNEDTLKHIADKLNSIKSASALVGVGDIAGMKVATDDELASNGARSDNWIWDKETNTYTNDATGLKKSSNKMSYAWWEKMLIDGGVGLGVAGIVGAELKDSIIGKIPTYGTGISIGAGALAGVAGVVALEATQIMPQSVYPVVKFTSNLLPKSELKDKYVDWIYKTFPEARIEQYNKEVAEYNKQWDDQDNVAAELQEKRLKSVFESVSNARVQSLGGYMCENAKVCGSQGTLKAVALKGESSVDSVYDEIHKCTTTMNQQFKNDITKTNDSSIESIKAQMRDYYLKVVDALDAYNEGALEGAATEYTNKSANFDLSVEGLKMTNRAYMKATMESLKELDSEYHFMNEEAWKQIEDKDIGGVGIENIRNYREGYFTTYESDSLKQIESLKAMKDETAENDTNKTTTQNTSTVKANESDIQSKRTGIESDMFSSPDMGSTSFSF